MALSSRSDHGAAAAGDGGEGQGALAALQKRHKRADARARPPEFAVLWMIQENGGCYVPGLEKGMPLDVAPRAMSPVSNTLRSDVAV